MIKNTHEHSNPRAAADLHRRNRLLASLPDDAFAFLAQRLTTSTMAKDQIVFESEETVDHAVFPQDCILSVVAIMTDGRSAETATAGNEGCVGLVSGLVDRRVINRCTVQVKGSATLLPLDWLEEAVARYPAVRDLQRRYLKVVVAQSLRWIACSSLHTVDLRSCRWLLMAHDRVEGDTFPMKQEYLAQLLGVRRATIGTVCGDLQRTGIIRYSRGSITILDRPRLESAACECYGVVRGYYERLFPVAEEV